MEITIGAACSLSVTVDKSNTAGAVGSGLVDVFATPMMIALMEKASARCLAQFLPEGQASVGTRIAVSHAAATPIGMTVTATAVITAADRRRVDFQVSASDGAGPVGAGTHTRFIIDTDRFLEKAERRKNEL